MLNYPENCCIILNGISVFFKKLQWFVWLIEILAVRLSCQLSSYGICSKNLFRPKSTSSHGSESLHHFFYDDMDGYHDYGLIPSKPIKYPPPWPILGQF
jgi:hypothetical protein